MHSPFAPQLGTNYCPTDKEVLDIKTILVEPTLRLKGLDDEIANLRRAIDKLREQRDSIAAYVEGHQALISPARRLPLDVIQEIFIACLPTHRYCVMSASEAPVLLGRICSAWRAISLSTPRLWAKLHIVRPTRPSDSSSEEPFEMKYTQRLETMKSWLGRSGDCALSISLDCGPSFMGVPHIPSLVQGSALFLQALIPFASRWREIDFKAQGPTLIEALSDLATSDVPLLQDMKIWEHPTEPVGLSSPSNGWASVGILQSPRLRKFSLAAGDLCPTELPLQWSQLTSLSLEDLIWSSRIGLTSDRVLEILSRCPQLQTCHLAVFDDENVGNTVGGSIIECPLLNSMSLSCRSILASTLPLFSRLSLSELQQFKLRAYSGSASQSMSSFSSFLAVSTRLERLDISTEPFSKASLMDLLRRLPQTIRRLDFTCGWATVGVQFPFDDDILAALTPSHDVPSPCCPSLRELYIRQCVTVSDAALLRLIKARMTAESCSPLEHVEVRFSRLEYPASGPSQFSPWLGLNDHPEDGPL
ncbi:hypothetical protein B0H13DRAFT_2073998 [Mycena leptocephala]|nr:hypothetical protein B0H13DRAFT_2073998 [Mycena leptocephala]